MKIIRNSTETTPGPGEWFTGNVYIDPVAAPSEPSRVQAATVHFTPGARTAWHTHPTRQTNRVFFEPGEDHWHGAAPDRFMTHLAMQEVDDQGNAVAWGEHVTDQEYNAARASQADGS